MALKIKKPYESKFFTGKGKYVIKLVDHLLIKQTWRLKDKNNKITIISKGLHEIRYKM